MGQQLRILTAVERDIRRPDTAQIYTFCGRHSSGTWFERLDTARVRNLQRSDTGRVRNFSSPQHFGHMDLKGCTQLGFVSSAARNIAGARS